MGTGAALARLSAAFGAAVVSFVTVVPAVSQTVPPPANPGSARAPARLSRIPYRPILLELRGLKLTSEQRQQVQAIFKAHRPELKALAGKFLTARQAWEQSGKIDIKERKALNDERRALLQAVNKEVLSVLTPEQQKQIEARRQRAASRHLR